MPLNIGEINKLQVKRETDISYILYQDGEPYEVFMHFNQATKRLVEGDVVNAFLYYDGKHRLCATMEDPLITTTKHGFIKCVAVKENVGCFMNIGTAKDILLSKDYLPANPKAWPKIGDTLPCILKVKKDTIVCKILSRDDVKDAPKSLKVGDSTTAYVTSFTSTGLICMTEEYDVIYVHKSMVRKKYRIGEEIILSIININAKNEYNGSTIAQKETMRLSDSEMILNYLKEMGGVIPLGNASTPEEINKIFTLSKSAFKRAVGALYKERLIEIEDHKIILKNEKH
jgi:predicted RNA-binding protein (virulence factor B family)